MTSRWNNQFAFRKF